MNNSFLRNRTVQHMIKWIVALSFALFTFYQIILAIGIETTRFGRLIGIVFYLAITVASFLDFSEKSGVWMAHSVLLVVALILRFITRLLSIGTVFGNLSFANPAMLVLVLICLLVTVGMILPVSAAGSYVRGDADGDGEVTITDATAIQRILAEIPTASFVEEAADVDGDGLNITDATSIQRYLAEFDNIYHINETVTVPDPTTPQPTTPQPTRDPYELPIV